MSLVVSADTSVFLVVTGHAHADARTTGKAATPFKHGLTFRFPSPHGTNDLTVAAPTDLTGCADLAAASILKPVCLPLNLTAVHHGVIHARLHDGAHAQRLAQQLIAVMSATPNPAHQSRCLHGCTHACMKTFNQET
jgi:hypothetical protein